MMVLGAGVPQQAQERLVRLMWVRTESKQFGKLIELLKYLKATQDQHVQKAESAICITCWMIVSKGDLPSHSRARHEVTGQFSRM